MAIIGDRQFGKKVKEEKYKPKSKDLKLAVMRYFRFKRQWICATECLFNDIMCFTPKDIIDVEVKVSKTDLWKGEAKKFKHYNYLNLKYMYRIPTKFYICIPDYLYDEAEKWVIATNEKYGIITFGTERKQFNFKDVFISRTATRLHTNLKNRDAILRRIMMRVCSENIGHIEKSITNN